MKKSLVESFVIAGIVLILCVPILSLVPIWHEFELINQTQYQLQLYCAFLLYSLTAIGLIFAAGLIAFRRKGFVLCPFVYFGKVVPGYTCIIFLYGVMRMHVTKCPSILP
jgi:hypothetical protein